MKKEDKVGKKRIKEKEKGKKGKKGRDIRPNNDGESWSPVHRW
jgi:hypothetical protein